MAQKHTKEVPANPQAELHQHPALAQAIATAAMAAAGEGEDFMVHKRRRDSDPGLDEAQAQRRTGRHAS